MNDKEVILKDCSGDQISISLHDDGNNQGGMVIDITTGDIGFRIESPEECEALIYELSQLNKLLRKSIEG